MGRDQPAQKGVVRARTETLAGYNHQKSCTACLIRHGWGVMGSIWRWEKWWQYEG